MEHLDAIFARRSVGRLAPPTPSADELALILEAAAAAPDHGELRPWRFIVLAGTDKDDFGLVLADAYQARCRAEAKEPTAGQLNKEATKLGRAPIVVVVAAVRRQSDTIPWIEQFAAAAAATQNALIATTALGFGSMWRTGDAVYDPAVKAALGLGDDDAVVGFLYLGTPAPGADEPPRRPDMTGLVEFWSARPAPRSAGGERVARLGDQLDLGR